MFGMLGNFCYYVVDEDVEFFRSFLVWSDGGVLEIGYLFVNNIFGEIIYSSFNNRRIKLMVLFVYNSMGSFGK